MPELLNPATKSCARSLRTQLFSKVVCRKTLERFGQLGKSVS